MFDLGENFRLDVSIEQSQLVNADSDLTFLANNLFPDSTVQLLERFESLFGVFVPDGTPTGRRKANLIAKMRAGGGLNKEFFYNIARGLGYYPESSDSPHIVILDGIYPLFRADISAADDPLYDNEDNIGSFTWVAVGTDVESDMRLQALFEEFKPFGTTVLFINN